MKALGSTEKAMKSIDKALKSIESTREREREIDGCLIHFNDFKER